MLFKKFTSSVLLLLLCSVYPKAEANATLVLRGYAIASSAFLCIAGAWLAHRQLPRFAGQEVFYGSPTFTLAGASVLFTIGAMGGVVGAYRLVRLGQNACRGDQSRVIPEL